MLVRISTAVVAAIVFAGSFAWSSRIVTLAQTPACLHGPNETDAERQLRRQALASARAINTRQSQLASVGDKRYVPFDQLGNVLLAPSGFETELVTNGKAYAFSIKDMRDPCRFTLFSDQNGVIFVGEALR